MEYRMVTFEIAHGDGIYKSQICNSCYCKSIYWLVGCSVLIYFFVLIFTLVVLRLNLNYRDGCLTR